MSDTLTPMMRQYYAVRGELPPNTILLFRLGDFYEMFMEDAKEASTILNIALAKRGETPMCGMPYHAARGYIEKLIAAGKKVAVCDQVGEVQTGKLVRREITQILTPGSLDDFGLEAKSHNYLAAVRMRKDRFGLAYADLSTGDLRIAEFATLGNLMDELARICPSEVLHGSEQAEAFGALPGATPLEGYHFETEPADAMLRDHFRVQSLDGFGAAKYPIGVGCAGALFHYLTRQLRRDMAHFRRLQTYSTDACLIIDAITQSHLELVEARGGKALSLLGTLDRTVTPMGARALREWILRPLRDLPEIHRRQGALTTLLSDPFVLGGLRERLGEIRDLERGVARLSLGSGNARDLAALQFSLEKVPGIQEILPALSPLLAELSRTLHPLPELVAELHRSLADEPPALLRDGGIIRDGFDPALDELRRASHEGKEWVAGLQEREIIRSGIKSLKVRFTSVFGYFIEITNSNLANVPADYQRKQTTVNGERFITPELKEIESKILGADERAKAREIELFQKLRALVLENLAAIQETAAAIGQLDVLVALAEAARLYGYCLPTVDDSGILSIQDGRHPVLDQRTGEERFVPNDVELNTELRRLAVITGPNMAGKSTYIRQVALLSLMAQMGSYIPATSAHIGIADRIFTRVGASDDLSRGQSTFMVEMNETANILNNATSKSLVILDEIGRGTSTFDGLSIAWSVAEHLHDLIGARTLFATHYHELTDLERTREGVINLSVSVREWNDQVIFLRRIVAGRADRSYGIQVARLAGLPDSVVERSKEILQNLERAELNAEGQPAIAQGARRRSAAILNHPELELF